MKPLLYLWNHPRRTGFIVFNLLVVGVLLAWAIYTNSLAGAGIGGLPNLIVGYTGMGLAIVVLIVGWIAWAAMVTSRHSHPPAPPPAGG